MKLGRERMDARALFMRLVMRDALTRLYRRLASWAFGLFALWAGLTLVNALMPYPAYLYHGLLMFGTALLPAFVLWPPEGDPVLALIRRVDEHMAIEAWLDGSESAFAASISQRAAQVLRAQADYRPPEDRARFARYALTVAGLALFALAQGLTLSQGRGLVLGWSPPPVIDDGPDYADSRAGRQAILPRLDAPQGETSSSAPMSQPWARGLGEAERRQGQAPGAVPAYPEGEGPAPEGGDEMGRQDRTQGSGQMGSPSDGSSGVSDSEGGSESLQDLTMGSSTDMPGYEGQGTALEADPLPDYLAQFESAFADSVGRESVLGHARSADELAGEISSYFASFDLRVAVDSGADPALASLMAAWRERMGQGAAP